MNNNTRPRLYGFIYIIYLREFINTNKDIYKIGCCEDIDQRKRQYPKGSILLFTHFTTNYMEIETKVKKIFRNKYVERRDCGIEYFEGDHHEMINDIFDIVKDINTYRKDEYKNEIVQKKTLRDFVDETLVYNNSITDTGIESDIIHKYYINTWLKKNNVDVTFYNVKEFSNNIAKIIGKPVKNVFIGRFLKDNTNAIKETNNNNVKKYYNDYINSKLIFSGEDSDRLKQSLINIDFKEWMKINNINENYKTSELTEHINKFFNITIYRSLQFSDKKISRGWKYIKFSNNT